MKLVTAAALAGLLATGAAHAAGTGCGGFAWSLDAERALLAAPEAGDTTALPPASSAPDAAPPAPKTSRRDTALSYFSC